MPVCLNISCYSARSNDSERALQAGKQYVFFMKYVSFFQKPALRLSDPFYGVCEIIDGQVDENPRRFEIFDAPRVLFLYINNGRPAILAIFLA